MKKKIISAGIKSQAFTTATLDVMSNLIDTTTNEVDTYIEPVRASVLSRFPILFSLLVTFGITTTFLGFEKIISQIGFFDRNPLLVLLLGISILALTGTLYKKLQ
jgi:hypothetical protein